MTRRTVLKKIGKIYRGEIGRTAKVVAFRKDDACSDVKRRERLYRELFLLDFR